MQLINSDQQYVSTSDSLNEQQKQTLALEKAQDEIELLREQVSFLQEYLSEQLRQQQAIEQELHHVNQELELMNAENQHLVEAKRLFLEEIKEFAKTLPADGETSRKALTRLLSKFYEEIAPSEELESVRKNNSESI
jgi:predicted membrane chloride channel (bestrophin family)